MATRATFPRLAQTFTDKQALVKTVQEACDSSNHTFSVTASTNTVVTFCCSSRRRDDRDACTAHLTARRAETKAPWALTEVNNRHSCTIPPAPVPKPVVDPKKRPPPASRDKIVKTSPALPDIDQKPLLRPLTPFELVFLSDSSVDDAQDPPVPLDAAPPSPISPRRFDPPAPPEERAKTAGASLYRGLPLAATSDPQHPYAFTASDCASALTFKCSPCLRRHALQLILSEVGFGDPSLVTSLLYLDPATLRDFLAQVKVEYGEETRRKMSDFSDSSVDDGRTRKQRVGGKAQHRFSSRLKDKQNKDGQKDVKWPPERKFPTAAELRDDIQECIEAGETSLPAADEDFAEGYLLAPRLHTSAQTQGFVIRAIHAHEPGGREVWRLTEQKLDHSHVDAANDGGADAMAVRGDAAEEIGRLGSKTAATTGTTSPTPTPSPLKTGEGTQVPQTSPRSPSPQTRRQRYAPTPRFPPSFNLECNAGPAPKDDGPGHEQTPRVSPTPSSRPIRRRNSSPSPSVPHQTPFADASPRAKNPRLTITTQVDASEKHPPFPRNERLSFDHLDSELGTLPFKGFLLGVAADLLPNLSKPQLVLLVNRLRIQQAGITSVSLLARVAAFGPNSLDDFIELFKRNPLGGIDHSPLVEGFVKALKEAVAHEAAQLA
ncbi:hypothetical protein JCM10296v2_002011 [Rhodotorula toruloides]